MKIPLIGLLACALFLGLHVGGDAIAADDAYLLGLEASQHEQYDAAFRYFQLAADSGHADAQYHCGRALELGVGVQQDTAEAVYYYRDAADAGHQAAREAIERIYFPRH